MTYYDQAVYKYLELLKQECIKTFEYIDKNDCDSGKVNINLFDTICIDNKKFKIHELHYGKMNINKNNNNNYNYWNKFIIRNKSRFYDYYKQDNITPFILEQYELSNNNVYLYDLSDIKINKNNNQKYYDTNIILSKYKLENNHNIWHNYHKIPSNIIFQNKLLNYKYIVTPFYPYIYPSKLNYKINSCNPYNNKHIIHNYKKIPIIENYKDKQILKYKKAATIKYITRDGESTFRNTIDYTSEYHKTKKNTIETIKELKKKENFSCSNNQYDMAQYFKDIQKEKKDRENLKKKYKNLSQSEIDLLNEEKYNEHLLHTNKTILEQNSHIFESINNCESKSIFRKSNKDNSKDNNKDNNIKSNTNDDLLNDLLSL